jgi:murein DD-endopeptidase MepM/ murein hydrolase activator NlpD
VIVQADGQDVPDSVPSLRLNDHVFPLFALGNHRFRALLPTTPLDSPGRLTIHVTQGEVNRNVAIALRARQFPTQSIWLPPIRNQPISEAEFDRVDAFKRIVTPKKLWNGAFLRPNQGLVSGAYGIRRYYNGVFAKDYYHRGVDYAGGYGSPVIAPAAGRVALVGLEQNGFRINGNMIGIDHGQGVTSAYLHLSRILVKEGDWVKPGQVIGAVGATGAVTGPHLHWGLYVHGLAVDPVPWRDQGFE